MTDPESPRGDRDSNDMYQCQVKLCCSFITCIKWLQTLLFRELTQLFIQMYFLGEPVCHFIHLHATREVTHGYQPQQHSLKRIVHSTAITGLIMMIFALDVSADAAQVRIKPNG